MKMKETVTVTVTKHGAKIWNDWGKKVGYLWLHNIPILIEDDSLTIQLWGIMMVFGGKKVSSAKPAFSNFEIGEKNYGK